MSRSSAAPLERRPPEGKLLVPADLLAAGVIGAAVNFPWELAHSVLYRSTAGFTWWDHLICCGLAALADGAGTALIYAAGALVFRDRRWPCRRTVPRLCLTLALGFTGAVVTERLALLLDWWSYGPAMPRLPGTDLGISPLVQFLVLPVLALFWILPRWWRYRGARSHGQHPNR